jgi:hypothetical protein
MLAFENNTTYMFKHWYKFFLSKTIIFTSVCHFNYFVLVLIKFFFFPIDRHLVVFISSKYFVRRIHLSAHAKSSLGFPLQLLGRTNEKNCHLLKLSQNVIFPRKKRKKKFFYLVCATVLSVRTKRDLFRNCFNCEFFKEKQIFPYCK